MDFNHASVEQQRRRSQLILSVKGVVLLVLATAMASYALNAPKIVEVTRLLVLSSMVGVGGALFLGYNLYQLSKHRVNFVAEVAPHIPITPTQLQQQFLLIDSRLEHAPIALFVVEDNQHEKMVQAINGNARRLIAPGRASNLPQLFTQIKEQEIGKRSVILFETEQGIERALLSSNRIAISEQNQTIVALMPVESELQLEAQNAWLKLIHVLTHEIMNSLTPVASLSRTASDLLIENQSQLPALDYQDLRMALDAISRRATGLADFVSSYRSLSNVPAANPELIELDHLLARLYALVSKDWTDRGGQVHLRCEPANLSVMADPNQLEQALINLIKNAEEATANLQQPELTLHAKLTRGGRMRLEISDNGPGVPDDVIAQIFTPFFSTKERGSGIGLALVRQLIQGNGGTVRYAHRVQGGAQFIVTI
jgi:signal transduction histidine kinase